MFGLLILTIRSLCSLYYNATMESIKQQNRYNAIQKEREIYFDGNGKTWYIQHNGKDIWVSKTKNLNNWHDVLVPVNNPKHIIKDYTKEQEIRDNIEFKLKYDEAKNNAIKEHKKYFYVKGFRVFDKRYGYYELETEKQYELSCCPSINGMQYYITYFISTKEEMQYCSTEMINKKTYEDLGGTFADNMIYQ